MRMEVEQKYRVDALEPVADALRELDVESSLPREEIDLYFAHPARDFAATDEALRIRRVGSSAFITYKGPKIDATTKTRHEIDLPLAAASEYSDAWQELLQVLGFRPVAEVRKHRRKALVPWGGRRIEVSLDEVEHVGTFVELELITDWPEMESAKASIAALAERLGLSKNERRSYLELLLQGREAPHTET